MSKKKCEYLDCSRGNFARGYCLMHYKRLWRAGKIELKPILTVCSIDDCSRPHLAKTYCKLHYRRYMEHGDPMIRLVQEYGGSESHPLYTTWLNMKARCYNANRPQFNDWGGRGIRVCERWLGKNGFIYFAEDVGPKPSPELSLDRIDNDGNYEPGNVRWATRHQQNMNRRVSV